MIQTVETYQTMTRPKVDPDKRIRTAQACESCKRRKQKVSIASDFLLWAWFYLFTRIPLHIPSVSHD